MVPKAEFAHLPVVLPGIEGSFRFRREEHLKKGSEIRKVFSKGKRVGCRGVKLFVLENGFPRNRICFTFSRGFAGAVKRNRARRIGREAYRVLKSGLNHGYDLVVLVYPEDANSAGAGLGLEDRLGQLRYLFAKAGLTGTGSAQ